MREAAEALERRRHPEREPPRGGDAGPPPYRPHGEEALPVGPKGGDVDAAELVVDHWYKVRLRQDLTLGAPDSPRRVTWRGGRAVTMVWRGRGDYPGADLRPVDAGAGRVAWVPTAGAFWTDDDLDGAFICAYEEVAVLEEVPNPRRRR
jgi:hypothetical protein